MKWALNIELFLVYIIICQGDSTQVTKDNIRQLLSDTEWQSLIGSTPETDYEIVDPRVRRLRRSPREHAISISGPGRVWFRAISPSDSILSREFILLKRHENGTEDITEKHREEYSCYYRGDDIARGIIAGNDSSYYIIRPLPDRFYNEISDEMPHLISKRILPKYFNSNNESDFENHSEKRIINFFDPSINLETKDRDAEIHDNNILDSGRAGFLEEEKSKNEKSTKRRKRGFRDSTNSGPIFVETAVFVDRDLYKHMSRNYPKDTERELIRFVLAMINAVMIRKFCFFENIYCLLKKIMKPHPALRTDNFQVQLLYHDPSLGQIVNFVLKRLEILHADPIDLHRPHDIDKYLSSFCQWQGRENPGTDQDKNHWDHALMLTGLDLYVVNKRGKVSSQVVGLAPVAGMCTKTSSCTVNEGRHFESVYVVAHEIGHNLGMRHDGGTSDNDCDPTSYIMSPTLGSGKITWSHCSRNYLKNFLRTAQSRCLLDHGSSGGQLDHSAEGILPGERFDSDHQCMLKYGFGSRHSTQQPLEDICRDIHCERERYTWTSHPALEGTYCGEDKWCRSGRCVNRNGRSRTGGSNEKIAGSWSGWHISECASGCLSEDRDDGSIDSTGIRVIMRTCTNPSPQNGGEKCVGPRKRYVACKATQCMKISRTTISEFADQICTRAREVDNDLMGTGLQRISSDPEEACTVWCHTRNKGAKSRGWIFPDGTKCRTRRNDFYRTSYCIAGRCEEFRCSGPDEYKFLNSPERCSGLNVNHVDRKDDIALLSQNLNPEKTKDNWIVSSDCHFNCLAPGIGIRLVSKIRPGRNETSIQLCDPDSNRCEKLKSPYQFATNICKKYKFRVRQLSGLGMQISPSIEDPDRPCRVACQDETVSHRFYLVNGENGWFPFGTSCSKRNHKSFCVAGKCLEFGEDDTPLHESIFALPLLSRNKRTASIDESAINRNLKKYSENVRNFSRNVTLLRKRRNLELDRTTILSHLNQRELDSIIWHLNFSGSYRTELLPFQIDLNNPIHVPFDESDYRFYDYTGYS
ncbi:A disintegrin and metalloproteinase with thrombospondin motifs 16 isoform X2 [Cephus cinctus]|uniref:A disintegrin and metalloproteinase with thrombospondin motifs 16 isoform X2 n=1 Tax=Cephus cinctus TaxID=211228 RepID=A0AAJ7R7L4_CEPCN|nr:A disintegrin and metalloproteinase with thrombospondin motifs 16 isoform X2 [Cephus cinctus]